MSEQIMRDELSVAAQLAALWRDAFKGSEYPIRESFVMNDRFRITDYRDKPKSYLVIVTEIRAECHECLHLVDAHGEHGCTAMVTINPKLGLPCSCPNDRQGERTTPVAPMPPLGGLR